jgi:hypothetical protein
MAFFQPRKGIYEDQIEIGPQPRIWLARHRRFASTEWIESQVRYGNWIPDKVDGNRFLIYASVVEGIKLLKVVLKIQLFETNISVIHTHILRKK